MLERRKWAGGVINSGSELFGFITGEKAFPGSDFFFFIIGESTLTGSETFFFITGEKAFPGSEVTVGHMRGGNWAPLGMG